MNWWIRTLQGVLVLILFVCIIQCIKKYDSHHGLPEKITGKAILIPLLSGLCIAEGNLVYKILLILCMGYLTAMAYTDYFTRKVYSMFYILATIPGAIWLVSMVDWRKINEILFFILIIIFASFVLHAFRDGDVEVFIALVPYIALLADKWELDLILALLGFLLSSMLFAVCGCLALSVKRKKFVKENAMVPSICVAMLCTILLDNLI